MKRHLGLAYLGLTIWFLIPSGARAQTSEYRGPSEEERSRSHVPIELQGTDFNQALRQRFESLRLNDDERDRWMKRAKDMADKFVKNPKDPEVERIAKELLQNEHANDWLNEELNAQKKAIPPEKFKEYEKTLKKYGAEKITWFSKDGSVHTGLAGQVMGKGANGREPPAGQDVPQDSGKIEAPREKTSGPDMQERMSPGGPSMGPRPGAPLAPAEQPTFGEKLARLFRKTVDVNKGALAESPAIQDALRELRRARSSAEPLAADDKSWVGQFARFSQSLTKNDLWSKMELPNLGKWQPPSSRSLPKVHSPWAAPSFDGMPGIGIPSATAIDRGLLLVWVALILAAGVLAWKLLGGHVPGIRRQARRDWKLGPWPVAPGAVGTRQDVVRAFEYLSLLKLGPVAQSRNHLDLAAELGEPEIEHRNAAERLAALYEKARYTPANEALSVDALATARRELCYLAGVKQA